jgi:hypothetical protein
VDVWIAVAALLMVVLSCDVEVAVLITADVIKITAPKFWKI